MPDEDTYKNSIPGKHRTSRNHMASDNAYALPSESILVVSTFSARQARRRNHESPMTDRDHCLEAKNAASILGIARDLL